MPATNAEKPAATLIDMAGKAGQFATFLRVAAASGLPRRGPETELDPVRLGTRRLTRRSS